MKIKFKPNLPSRIVNSICNTISRNVTTFIATYQEEFWRELGFTGEVYVFDRHCSEGPIVICSGLTPEKPALVGRLYGGKPTSDEVQLYTLFSFFLGGGAPTMKTETQKIIYI
nr:unnamed protein product [Callosobruchus chinensis]